LGARHGDAQKEKKGRRPGAFSEAGEGILSTGEEPQAESGVREEKATSH